MTFAVLLHPKAARSPRKLQASIRSRVLVSMKELEQSPEKGEPLKPSRFWRLRVGDHRAIYEIDRQSGRVIVLFVGHKKNVYDEFSRLM